MGGIIKGATSFAGHAMEAGPALQSYSINTGVIGKEIQAAEENALVTEQRSAILSGLARQQGTKLIAKQRVAYTAGGVDASVGTAADVAAETSMLTELDSMTIRNNAMREAMGHRAVANSAKVKRMQLDAAYEAGETARILTLTGDAATMVGGAAGLG